jgi:hypothetical protein
MRSQAVLSALLVGGALIGVTRIGVAADISPIPAPPPPASAAPAPLDVTPLGYYPPPPLLFSERLHRSPGLAVALSLQPLPIDFGNLYAENIGWGVTYTAIEVALMAPMMWMTGSHMSHAGMTRVGDDGSWSDREKGAMVGLAAGYVLVKLAAGLHAGRAAQGFNLMYERRATALVAPTAGGALLVWSARL